MLVTVINKYVTVINKYVFQHALIFFILLQVFSSIFIVKIQFLASAF
jgi:hypothetical protein